MKHCELFRAGSTTFHLCLEFSNLILHDCCVALLLQLRLMELFFELCYLSSEELELLLTVWVLAHFGPTLWTLAKMSNIGIIGYVFGAFGGKLALERKLVKLVHD
jgi:hypothetical protein